MIGCPKPHFCLYVSHTSGYSGTIALPEASALGTLKEVEGAYGSVPLYKLFKTNLFTGSFNLKLFYTGPP